MPTTTRSFCAIIHSLPCSVRGSKPFQLFGLRKTPELSLALLQALSPSGAAGSAPATGGFDPTARSHILPNFLDTRAQGMPGARSARSRAWCVVNTRVSHHGYAGNTRHSPRNGFNGFLRALPGDRALLSPSPMRSVSFLRAWHRRRDARTTRLRRPPRPARRAAPRRPPHPAPNVRDDRETPLERRRDQTAIRLFLPRRQVNFGKSETGSAGVKPAIAGTPVAL